MRWFARCAAGIVAAALLTACSGEPEPTAKPGAGQASAPPQEPRSEPAGKPLLAAVKAAPSSGPAPLRVQFNVHAQGGTAPLSVAWNFGDGSSHESMAAPTHTYATPGVYRATVEIKDAAGDTASHWVEIRVQ